MAKILYNTELNLILPYPDESDAFVVGLAPELLEMTLIEFDAPPYNPLIENIVKTESINIEDKIITRGWEIVTLPVLPPEPPHVPRAVTTRQMKIALALTNKLPGIIAFIAALPEPKKTIVDITFNDSNEFERANSMLNEMAALMGLTKEEIDQLFIFASTL